MILKVIGYFNGSPDYHICVRDGFGRLYVDLTCTKSFPKDFDPFSLVGKVVEVDDELSPYIEIARDVRIIDEFHLEVEHESDCPF